MRLPLSDKPQILLHHWSDGGRCCGGLGAHVTGKSCFGCPSLPAARAGSVEVHHLGQLSAAMARGSYPPRLCQNAKFLGFRVSLYPSRSATRPVPSILAGRLLRWPAPAHVFTQPRPQRDNHSSSIPNIRPVAFRLKPASRFVTDTSSLLDQSGLDCLLAQKC